MTNATTSSLTRRRFLKLALSDVRFVAIVAMAGLLSTVCAATDTVQIQRDEANGRATVLLNGTEAFVYQYAELLDMPHFWPVRSPSGKLLTVQHPPTNRFPHHRSMWIVDHVQLTGHKSIDFYHSQKNQAKSNDPESPFLHRIRHMEFSTEKVEDGRARIGMNLLWEIDGKTPVLDQELTSTLYPLGDDREYLVDLLFTLTATHGDVTFNSDWVHYGWPFVRMHPQFSGEQGGAIIDNRGRTGQEDTNGQYATWIDYSNTIDGVTEGLTIFSHPSNGRQKWLTREYGTFGPRRADEFSGTHFTLEKGKSISGRAGILVHRGDVKSGQVAERFQKYLELTNAGSSSSTASKRCISGTSELLSIPK